ncbi:lysine--tRNA ligase [Candidatus Dojkabacteria bacterium]|uniref:Lysine--tRNA ligase n=1 Tax=Candidatus Dojkabacteria bacterium TaxID=2099670 RepID=A0A3M0Z4Z0_9BACT|nr:MAG: lysine--tRNA ligase [Candidatus Dojkabacteria bacterium]
MQVASDLLGQRSVRIAKLNKLREIGVDPYPAKSFKNIKNNDLVVRFEDLKGKEFTVAGRILSIRKHGAICFWDLLDESGKIQIYLKKDLVEPLDTSSSYAQYLGFDEMDLFDEGDYAELVGELIKTKSGEISIQARKLRILAKSLRPIPLELEDKEERFRRRYLDMKIHPEVMDRMKRRSLFWQAHREFLNKRGFYEINIPVLEHIPGGGDAVPFTTHMRAIDEVFYLRISHELPLKRLIGAGFEKIYDIGPRFRNEGLSDEHLPEHVAMEFYWSYADWRDGMNLVKELFEYVINTVYNGKTKFQIREHEVDFSKGWEEIDFADVFQDEYGIDHIYNITIEEVKELMSKNHIQFEENINIPRGVDALWKKVRRKISGPAFLINHPKYLSPLQKPSSVNPSVVERFQPIVAGSELGNGWSELNDPIDQYERFLQQQRLRDEGDEEAQWLDIDYVEMMEYGMAPNFGYGHSERVFWFLENVSAREGVPFPHLKREVAPLTKKIYPEVFDKQV